MKKRGKLGKKARERVKKGEGVGKKRGDRTGTAHVKRLDGDRTVSGTGRILGREGRKGSREREVPALTIDSRCLFPGSRGKKHALGTPGRSLYAYERQSGPRTYIPLPDPVPPAFLRLFPFREVPFFNRRIFFSLCYASFFLNDGRESKVYFQQHTRRARIRIRIRAVY